MDQTTFHGSRAQLMERLRQLPKLLSGRTIASSDVASQVLGALGLQALSLIKEAYIVKARGGTDEAGISWAPLSPKYVAYSRRHPGLARKRAAAAKAGRARRPLLTAAQDKLWRQIFARSLRRFQRAGRGDAKGAAAAIAWATLKRAGGKTILAEYGNRPHEIGRDTGRLFNSLSPGSAPAAANEDQIFRTDPGAVTVGTNIAYAAPFHKRRPLWPDEANIPASWWQRLGETLGDGIEMVLRQLGG